MRESTPAITYLLAVVTTAAIVAVRWLLDPLLGDQLPFGLFFGAVLVTAWIGGLRPALLATGLSLGSALFFFVPPRFVFSITSGSNLLSAGVFAAVSLAIAALGEALRRSRFRHERREERVERWFPAVLAGAEEKLWRYDVRDILGFAALLSVLVAGGVLGNLNTRRLLDNERRVTRTHEVLARLETLLSALKDAETGQRGYLLTGNESYLQPYESAVDEIPGAVDRLVQLTADNPARQARILALKPVIAQRLDELRRTLDLAKAGDALAALELVRSGVGRNLMDQLRAEVTDLENGEQGLLAERSAEAAASARTTTLSLVLTAVTGILLLVVVFYLSRRNFLQRRRAAEVIGEQRERLRVTLASIGDAVITTDARSRVSYMNAVAQELTGWTQDEAEGQLLETVFRIVNEQTRQKVENPVQKVLQLGRIVGLANHTLLLARDGRERPIDDSAAPIRDAQGRMQGVVLVFRDVTEQRAAEGALREADRRKDEFLATLSHELRNPLAPLKNSLEVMKRAAGDGELIEHSRATMERQMGQMVRLIDDLLDVSRITRNLVELRQEEVELASVLHHAVEACRPMIDGAGQQLAIAMPEEPVYLSADAVRLAQVFGNLLTNASKFTEPGGRIELTAEPEGGEVVVTVRDTGVGIPPDMLPQVFDLFIQIDRTLERSQGGLGIGLTLVRRLVEMHAGTVTAHSDGFGQGSTFVVRLPVLSERPKGLATSGPAEPAGERPAISHRILVVDDNRDSAVSLAKLLQLTGYDTRLAHDGEEAVARAAEYRPALILLDIGLPKKNGYDACRDIREQPWGREIKLVALTGWGQEEDRRKSKAAGFDGHLVKPVDYATLMELLATLSEDRA